MPTQFSSMTVDTGDQQFITAYIEGQERPLMVGSDHPNFLEIKQRLDAALEARLGGDEYTLGLVLDGLPALFDIPQMLAEKFRRLSDRFTVKNGTIFRDGDPLENYFSRTVLSLLDEGSDIDPVINFQERIEANPSERSREQALEWFNKHGVQITPEGKLVLYKGVEDAEGEGRYKSVHSGHGFVDGEEFHNSQLPNYVGAEVRMPRSEVDDNPHSACSTGLHCSTFEYAQSWGRSGAMLEVLVDPADIGSVPDSASKIRCCRYVVTDVLEKRREGTLTPTAYDEPSPFIVVGEGLFTAHDLRDDADDPEDSYDDVEEDCGGCLNPESECTCADEDDLYSYYSDEPYRY